MPGTSNATGIGFCSSIQHYNRYMRSKIARRLLVCFAICLTVSRFVQGADLAKGGQSLTAARRQSHDDRPTSHRQYLHPPSTLKLIAEPGQAKLRKCVGCAEAAFSSLTLGAIGSPIQIDGDKAITQEVRVAGTYQIAPAAGTGSRVTGTTFMSKATRLCFTGGARDMA